MAFKSFNTFVDGDQTEVKYFVPGIDSCIERLRPGAIYDMRLEEGVVKFNTWEHEVPPPTMQEINEELKIQEEMYAYYEYERSRNNSYPDGETQLDMLFHDIEENNLSNGKWVTAIRKVKNKFPKPVGSFSPPHKKLSH